MKKVCLAAPGTIAVFTCFIVGCASQSRPLGEAPTASSVPANSADADAQSRPPSANGGDDTEPAENPEAKPMRITIGATTLPATLNDNATARTLRAALPLTLSMTDLNANEKYARLPSRLPEDASNPGTIHAGDVMLYGSDTLVLFYETFTTSYAYTRIGKCDDLSALRTALGSSGVTVTFSP